MDGHSLRLEGHHLLREDLEDVLVVGQVDAGQEGAHRNEAVRRRRLSPVPLHEADDGVDDVGEHVGAEAREGLVGVGQGGRVVLGPARQRRALPAARGGPGTYDVYTVCEDSLIPLSTTLINFSDKGSLLNLLWDSEYRVTIHNGKNLTLT